MLENAGETWIRQPIVVVLGHVDHGKTTLLDKIRGTAVARKEPGEITQHVGASMVPASVLKKVVEPLRRFFPKLTIEIPGILFIDTPGHELFSNLRRRGGSVADLAILVVDVVEGFQKQTYEALNILKEKKVPFVVAANKIDRVDGWVSKPDSSFLESLKSQNPRALNKLDERIYSIVSKLYEQGFEAERFDRVRDFRKTVAIVPISAKTGEGIPELLALITGLVQQFMKKRLVSKNEPGKGVVLEVKEEAGYGTTVDAIIFDGVLKKGDTIVLAGKSGPIVTKVRALLMPRPLQDMRMHEGFFTQIDQVVAAAGVKISASNLDDALAGSPIYVALSDEHVSELVKAVSEEVSGIIVRSSNSGLVVKADTLGTLEALTSALKQMNIPVRIADVGPVSQSDVLEAAIVGKSIPEYKVVLAFNVKILPEAKSTAQKENVTILYHNVIYQLLEELDKWIKEIRTKEKMKELEGLIRPGKIRILPGYVFRRSDPAIVGVEVLGGRIRPGYPLMREDGLEIGVIQQIRDKDQVLKEAIVGSSIAISIKGHVMVGRQIDEGDVLYTSIPKDHATLWLTKYKNELSNDELLVLKEIISIKKKKDPFYGGFLQI